MSGPSGWRDRRAVRYDITFAPAAWPLVSGRVLDDHPGSDRRARQLRDGRVLGVDLNADHLAACVLDSSGNPVGEPVTIGVDTAGLPAAAAMGGSGRRSPRLLDLAVQHNCTAVVVENLDFADARCTGRETLGRGRRGKRLRRTVAGIPTAKFRVPAHLDGVPPRYRGDRRGPRLHQHVGAPALAQTPTATDFRSGHCHRASWCGGRDRQTWTRHADQASAGRTPHPTADACGHSTGQT